MYKLKIEQDTSPWNPRTDCDNAGKMICFHKRYTWGDKHDLNFSSFYSWDEVEDHLFKELGAVITIPLFLLDHGGITMSTTPFNDKWDSGQVGFIYMDRETILKEAPGSPKILTPKAKEWATKCLESEVKEYGQYLTGDVWGYIIEDDEGNEIEACWGYYGEDCCRTEGEAVLASFQLKEAA
jgi:hypothetical protein